MTRRLVTLLGVLILVLTSCGTIASTTPNTPNPAASSPSGTARFPLTITDDRGKSVTFTTSPRRIVSIAPSSTEVLFAIGAGDRVVAVDDFSDFPAAANALPKVGGFKASPEKIISFQPDVVLAVTTGDLASILETQGRPVLIFEPRDMEAVYRSIEAIGSLVERDAAAGDLVKTMRARITAVGEKVKGATKVRVLHEIDASDPTKIFVAGSGNFIDAMITIAGGVNVAANATTAYPQLSSEEIVRSDPQVIVLSDATYGSPPEVVVARAGWSAITAVKTSRVFPIDPDIVSRPGPRLVDGVESYAKLLHPELFK